MPSADQIPHDPSRLAREAVGLCSVLVEDRDIVAQVLQNQARPEAVGDVAGLRTHGLEAIPWGPVGLGGIVFSLCVTSARADA